MLLSRFPDRSKRFFCAAEKDYALCRHKGCCSRLLICQSGAQSPAAHLNRSADQTAQAPSDPRNKAVRLRPLRLMRDAGSNYQWRYSEISPINMRPESVTLTATQIGKKLSVKRYKRFESAQLQGHVKKYFLRKEADRLSDILRMHGGGLQLPLLSALPGSAAQQIKGQGFKDPDRTDLFQNRSADQTVRASVRSAGDRWFESTRFD